MRVCVTGGTGSLGGALIERLSYDGADRIVTIARREQDRYRLEAAYAWHPHVKVYKADIEAADLSELTDAFYGCEVVVHAAARKCVSGHHGEPRAMHQANVLGTQHVIDAARGAGVGKVLLISSDKCVQATNVYGVSKALAEHLVISANAKTFSHGLRLSVLRYGNVLNSNGSVLRVWRDLAAQGKELPLSDARMTRFWLTLPMAVDRVLKAIADMRGGEVFVPLLRAAPLTRLLEAVAPGAAIREIGIRPGGEKLHEILISEDEARRGLRRNGWIVIPPPNTSDHWERWAYLGEPVGEDFRYCSSDWPEQWSVAELRALLAPAAVEAPA